MDRSFDTVVAKFFKNARYPSLLTDHAQELHKSRSALETHRAAVKLAFVGTQYLTQLAYRAYSHADAAAAVELKVGEAWKKKDEARAQPTMGMWTGLLRELSRLKVGDGDRALLPRAFEANAEMPAVAAFARAWAQVSAAHEENLKAGVPSTARAIVQTANARLQQAGSTKSKPLDCLDTMVAFRNTVAHAVEWGFPDDDVVLAWMNDFMVPALIEFLSSSQLRSLLCEHACVEVERADTDYKTGGSRGSALRQNKDEDRVQVHGVAGLNPGAVYFARLDESEEVATVLFKFTFDPRWWPPPRALAAAASLPPSVGSPLRNSVTTEPTVRPRGSEVDDAEWSELVVPAPLSPAPPTLASRSDRPLAADAESIAKLRVQDPGPPPARIDPVPLPTPLSTPGLPEAVVRIDPAPAVTEWYVNVGDRDWEDERRLGFWSAGGAPRYTRAVGRLRPGDLVYAYFGGSGYVGAGQVRTSAARLEDRLAGPIAAGGVPSKVTQAYLDGNAALADADAEVAVEIAWGRTVSAAKALRPQGLFTTTHAACLLTHAATLDRLRAEFPFPGDFPPLAAWDILEEPQIERKTITRRRRILLADLIAHGTVLVGDEIWFKQEPERKAVLLDGQQCRFEGQSMSINAFALQVSGWSAVNIYDWVWHGRSDALLEDLRSRVEAEGATQTVPPATDEHDEADAGDGPESDDDIGVVADRLSSIIGDLDRGAGVSKSDALAAYAAQFDKMADGRWNVAVNQLKFEGRVAQEKEKRWARYRKVAD